MIEDMMKSLNHKVQVKDAWDERREINLLETLLVDVKGMKVQYSIPEIEAVFVAVEAKLAGWAGLSLAEQKAKLTYEIQWVEDNKRYPTWKLAQDAYKKRLTGVEYLIAKQEIEADVAQAMGFAATTKSNKVKTLAAELRAMLSGNAPVVILQQKALALENEVAKLEAAKAAREAKKLPASISFDESNFTQDRKDAAMKEETSRQNADDMVRGVCEKVWKKAKQDERDAAYCYTSDNSYVNEPARG